MTWVQKTITRFALWLYSVANPTTAVSLKYPHPKHYIPYLVLKGERAASAQLRADIRALKAELASLKPKAGTDGQV